MNENIYNALINILAVEYLIKTNNRNLYAKYCTKIGKVYLNHSNLLDKIVASIVIHNHINNLGEMITQDDYDDLKDELIELLEGDENNE